MPDMLPKPAVGSPRTISASHLVQWIFRRDGHAVTCQVAAGDTPLSYDVCLVPHWDVAATSIETVRSPFQAMQRHAEIAKQLLDAGWLVTRRTTVRARD